MLERLGRPLKGFSDALASGVNAIFRGLGTPGKLLQDFLNGSWLGHSLHPVLVDIVVGGATAVLLLDILRVVFGVSELEAAGAWVLGLVVLSALASILTGLTDFKDTAAGNERSITGMHGTVNIIGTVVLAVSFVLRLGGGHDAAFWWLLAGYLILSFGAFVGGHIVFKYGYMVNFNAFQKGRRAKEFTAVMPADELAEATPTKATVGATALLLVRRGEVVDALKETCAHAGGPLSQGELRGDTIVCPWHGSAFRLADGAVRHGPASHRQVRYEARIAGGQVEVRGPHD
jgi:nitrite reductase/ring-hydroxylating ferredoxin subunit/uncharacterized membrane protein